MLDFASKSLVLLCAAALLLIARTAFAASGECTAGISGNVGTGAAATWSCDQVCDDPTTCSTSSGSNSYHVEEVYYPAPPASPMYSGHEPSTVVVTTCACGDNEEPCCDVVLVTLGNTWGDPGWGVSGECEEQNEDCPPGDYCNENVYNYNPITGQFYASAVCQ